MSFKDWLKDFGGRTGGEIEWLTHTQFGNHDPYIEPVVGSGRIWRSSWPTTAMLLYAKDNGVTDVINWCKERTQDQLVIACGLVPHNIGVIDATAPSLAQVQEANAISKGKKTLHHCKAGKGRTDCGVAGELILVEGWTVENVLASDPRFKDLNPGQLKFIESLASHK